MQRIVQHHTTMVVMPWWTVYWTPCYRYLARRIRKAGIELVILCHNVLDHERATWKHILTRSVLQYASRFIVQSREGRRQLQVLFPHIPAEFLLLPIFDQYPQPRGALKRRASLELLFFGLIRPYKGLDLLLDAMAQLRGKDVFLSIVGEFWSSQQDTERQITRLRLSDHVELIPRYVTDEEAAEYFCRADVVVLPYRSATGSGVVSMAYHYEKPVIVTRVGGLADAVEHRRTGLVLPPDSSSEIASAIEAFREGSLPCFHRALQHLKTEMSWEHFARAIIDGSTTSARNRELAPGTVS